MWKIEAWEKDQQEESQMVIKPVREAVGDYLSQGPSSNGAEGWTIAGDAHKL